MQTKSFYMPIKKSRFTQNAPQWTCSWTLHIFKGFSHVPESPVSENTKFQMVLWVFEWLIHYNNSAAIWILAVSLVRLSGI
jgi:hypothetical protein